MPEPHSWEYTEDTRGRSSARAGYRPRKVIVAIEHEDGTITALAGVPHDVEIEMERDEFSDFLWSNTRERSLSAPRYSVHVEFSGAVEYAHMAGFDDIPDPQTPPDELENRKAIEAPRKELEG